MASLGGPTLLTTAEPRKHFSRASASVETFAEPGAFVLNGSAVRETAAGACRIPAALNLERESRAASNTDTAPLSPALRLRDNSSSLVRSYRQVSSPRPAEDTADSHLRDFGAASALRLPGHEHRPRSSHHVRRKATRPPTPLGRPDSSRGMHTGLADSLSFSTSHCSTAPPASPSLAELPVFHRLLAQTEQEHRRRRQEKQLSHCQASRGSPTTPPGEGRLAVCSPDSGNSARGSSVDSSAFLRSLIWAVAEKASLSPASLKALDTLDDDASELATLREFPSAPRGTADPPFLRHPSRPFSQGSTAGSTGPAASDIWGEKRRDFAFAQENSPRDSRGFSVSFRKESGGRGSNSDGGSITADSPGVRTHEVTFAAKRAESKRRTQSAVGSAQGKALFSLSSPDTAASWGASSDLSAHGRPPDEAPESWRLSDSLPAVGHVSGLTPRMYIQRNRVDEWASHEEARVLLAQTTGSLAQSWAVQKPVSASFCGRIASVSLPSARPPLLKFCPLFGAGGDSPSSYVHLRVASSRSAGGVACEAETSPGSSPHRRASSGVDEEGKEAARDVVFGPGSGQKTLLRRSREEGEHNPASAVHDVHFLSNRHSGGGASFSPSHHLAVSSPFGREKDFAADMLLRLSRLSEDVDRRRRLSSRVDGEAAREPRESGRGAVRRRRASHENREDLPLSVSALRTSDSFASLSRGRSVKAANSLSASAASWSRRSSSPRDSHLDVWNSFQDPPGRVVQSGGTCEPADLSTASLFPHAGRVSAAYGSPRDVSVEASFLGGGSCPNLVSSLPSALRDSHLDDWVSIQVRPEASPWSSSRRLLPSTDASAASLRSSSAPKELETSLLPAGEGTFSSCASQLGRRQSPLHSAGVSLQASLQHVALQTEPATTAEEPLSAEDWSASFRGQGSAAGGVIVSMKATETNEHTAEASRRTRSAGDERRASFEGLAEAPEARHFRRASTESRAQGGNLYKEERGCHGFTLEPECPGAAEGTSREEAADLVTNREKLRGFRCVGGDGRGRKTTLHIGQKPILVAPREGTTSTPLSQETFHSSHPHAVLGSALESYAAPYRGAGEPCELGPEPGNSGVYVHSAPPGDVRSAPELETRSGSVREVHGEENFGEQDTSLFVSSGEPLPEKIVLLPRQLETLREEQKAIQRRQEQRREQQALQARKMQEIQRQQLALQALMSRVRLESRPLKAHSAFLSEVRGAPPEGNSDLRNLPHSPQVPSAVSVQLEAALRKSIATSNAETGTHPQEVGEEALKGCLHDAVYLQISGEGLSPLSFANGRSLGLEEPRTTLLSGNLARDRRTWMQTEEVTKRGLSVPTGGELRHRMRAQVSRQPTTSPAEMLRSLSLSVRPDRRDEERVFNVEEGERGEGLRVGRVGAGAVQPEALHAETAGAPSITSVKIENSFAAMRAAAKVGDIKRERPVSIRRGQPVCAICEQKLQVPADAQEARENCTDPGRATRREGEDLSKQVSEGLRSSVKNAELESASEDVAVSSTPQPRSSLPAVSPLAPSPRPASPPPRGPRLGLFSSKFCVVNPLRGKEGEAGKGSKGKQSPRQGRRSGGSGGGAVGSREILDARGARSALNISSGGSGRERRDTGGATETSTICKSCSGLAKQRLLVSNPSSNSTLGPSSQLSFRPLDSSVSSLSSSSSAALGLVGDPLPPASAADCVESAKERAAAERVADLTAHLLSSVDSTETRCSSLLSSLPPLALSLLSSLHAPGSARLSGLLQHLLPPCTDTCGDDGGFRGKAREKEGGLSSSAMPGEKKAEYSGQEVSPFPPQKRAERRKAGRSTTSSRPLHQLTPSEVLPPLWTACGERTGAEGRKERGELSFCRRGAHALADGSTDGVSVHKRVTTREVKEEDERMGQKKRSGGEREANGETEGLSREEIKSWEKFFDGERPLTLSALDVSSWAQPSKSGKKKNSDSWQASFDEAGVKQRARRQQSAGKPHKREEKEKSARERNGGVSPSLLAVADSPRDAQKATCQVYRQLLEVLVERLKQREAAGTNLSPGEATEGHDKQGETEETRAEQPKKGRARGPERDLLAELLPLLLLLSHEALRSEIPRANDWRKSDAEERQKSTSEVTAQVRGRESKRSEGDRRGNSKEERADRHRAASRREKKGALLMPAANGLVHSQPETRNPDRKSTHIKPSSPCGVERQRKREQRKTREGKDASAAARERKPLVTDDFDFRPEEPRGRTSRDKSFRRERSYGQNKGEVYVHRERRDSSSSLVEGREPRRRRSTVATGGAGAPISLESKEERHSRAPNKSSRCADTWTKPAKTRSVSKLRDEESVEQSADSHLKSPMWSRAISRVPVGAVVPEPLVRLPLPPGDVVDVFSLQGATGEGALKEDMLRLSHLLEETLRRKDKDEKRKKAAIGSKDLVDAGSFTPGEAKVGGGTTAKVPLTAVETAEDFSSKDGKEKRSLGNDGHRAPSRQLSAGHLTEECGNKKGQKESRVADSRVVWKPNEGPEKRGASPKNGGSEERTTASSTSRSSHTRASSPAQEFEESLWSRSSGKTAWNGRSRGHRSPLASPLERKRWFLMEPCSGRDSSSSANCQGSFVSSPEKSERKSLREERRGPQDVAPDISRDIGASGSEDGARSRGASSASPARRHVDRKKNKRRERSKKKEDGRLLLALLDSIQLFVDTETAKRAEARGALPPRESADRQGEKRKGKERRERSAATRETTEFTETALWLADEGPDRLETACIGGRSSAPLEKRATGCRTRPRIEETREKLEEREPGSASGEAAASERCGLKKSLAQDAFSAKGDKKSLGLKSSGAPTHAMPAEAKPPPPAQEEWTESERKVEAFFQTRMRHGRACGLSPDPPRAAKQSRVSPSSASSTWWKETPAPCRLSSQEASRVLRGKETAAKLSRRSAENKEQRAPERPRRGGVAGEELAQSRGEENEGEPSKATDEKEETLSSQDRPATRLEPDLGIGFRELVLQDSEADGGERESRRSSAGGFSEFFTPLSASASSFAGVEATPHLKRELRNSAPHASCLRKNSPSVALVARELPAVSVSERQQRQLSVGDNGNKKGEDLWVKAGSEPSLASRLGSSFPGPTAVGLGHSQSDAQALQRCLSYLRRLEGASRKCLARRSESSSEESASSVSNGDRVDTHTYRYTGVPRFPSASSPHETASKIAEAATPVRPRPPTSTANKDLAGSKKESRVVAEDPDGKDWRLNGGDAQRSRQRKKGRVASGGETGEQRLWTFEGSRAYSEASEGGKLCKPKGGLGFSATLARRKASKIGSLNAFRADLLEREDGPSDDSGDDAELRKRLSNSSSSSFPYVGLRSWAPTDVAE
ncbi:UNVERIFIED_CONTAM: hypothetical protein HHA_225270 [Hammondia hammondi]|eukprot:XP_008881908.1 hypothetical protein HHA_225270 [Hammondia hammondi]